LKNNLLFSMRGFPKTSVFGKSTLDLKEKLAFWTVFPEPFSKLTEFWKRLMILNFSASIIDRNYLIQICGVSGEKK